MRPYFAETDETHDPARRSWVDSANAADTDFPIQNLPFGVVKGRRAADLPGVGVAIGDQVLDVATAAGMLPDHFAETEVKRAVDACMQPTLNALMALGPGPRRALRQAIGAILDAAHPQAAQHARALAHALVPMDRLDCLVPARVGDYTDFYASVHHATNVGSMFRPDNPLLPNYKWVPIGYHGRASSIVASGTPIVRPAGQRKGAPEADPALGASRSLDYECEVGAFVAHGNAMGTTVPLSQAEAHIFGLCLVNDWSARDVQSWEYQPLGPFLAKNFATTVSPWVVTSEALAPFRVPLAPRAEGDPAPLPYLADAGDASHGGVAMTLEVRLATARMRADGHAAHVVSRTRFTHMYWSMAQMVAHHTVNGCNLQPGDLLASGTVSGPTPEERGCLLERTWRGAEPLTLPTGETRAFLEDGDVVTLAAWCEADGARRIGFGECTGEVVAAR
jgi:fumarylacetoacetase